MEHLNHPLIGPASGLPPPEKIEPKNPLALPNELAIQESHPTTPPPKTAYLEEGAVAMVSLALSEGKQNVHPPELATLVVCALKANNLDLVKSLCKAGFSLNTPEPTTGRTILVLQAANAATENDFAILDELVKLGADVNAPDSTGTTPYMHAACAGNTDAMKWLEDKGANTKATDALGQTALMRVLDNKDMPKEAMTNTISRLIDTAGIDAKTCDKAGLTALGHAFLASGRDIQVVARLVSTLSQKKIDTIPLLQGLGLSGKELTYWTNCTGAVSHNVLKDAGEAEWTNLQAKLPNKPPPPPVPDAPKGGDASAFAKALTAVTSDGNTPLHIAVAYGADVHLIQLLIKSGVNLEAPNILGQTALDLSQIKKNAPIATLLIDAGAVDRDLPSLRESYTEHISLSPPLAQQGINDPRSTENKARFDAFPGEHLPEVQEAIKAMVDATDYVSFNDFLKQFDEVIAGLNTEIAANEKLTGEKEEYIVLVEPRKSNKWLAELAFAKLKTPPKDIIRMDELQVTLANNKGVKRIVFFDDASYSGEQLCRFIRDNGVAALTKTGTTDFTVNVAVPYMTEWAKNKITAINQDNNVQGKGQIKLPEKIVTMRSAKDQVPEIHHQALHKTYFPDFVIKDIYDVYLLFELKDHELDHLGEILSEYGFPEAELFNEIFTQCEDILNTPGADKWSAVQICYEFMKDKKVLEGGPRFSNALANFFMAHENTMKERLLHPDTPADEKARINTFGILMENVVAGKERLNYDKGLESRTLTVFDHKVADELSTCPAYELGGIYENGDLATKIYQLFFGKPPYKQIYL